MMKFWKELLVAAAVGSLMTLVFTLLTNNTYHAGFQAGERHGREEAYYTMSIDATLAYLKCVTGPCEKERSESLIIEKAAHAHLKKEGFKQ